MLYLLWFNVHQRCSLYAMLISVSASGCCVCHVIAWGSVRCSHTYEPPIPMLYIQFLKNHKKIDATQFNVWYWWAHCLCSEVSAEHAVLLQAARLFHHMHGLMWPAWKTQHAKHAGNKSTSTVSICNSSPKQKAMSLSDTSAGFGTRHNGVHSISQDILLISFVTVQHIEKSSRKRKDSNGRLTTTAYRLQETQQLGSCADQHLFRLLPLKTKARS